MTDASVTPGKKFDNQRLIFIAMILSSAALSVVSAYETYLGLLDFMGTTFFGKVASGILTFGIQVLLFAISWSIANHLKDGFRANIPRWIIWVLCAFFSGYFSYYGFFETTGGRNEDVRMSAVNQEASDLYLSVEEHLVAELNQEHAALIGGEDALEYKAWTENSLRAVIAVANDPDVENDIAEAARNARGALVSEQEGFRNRRAPLLTEQASLQAVQAQSNGTLQSARDRKTELEASMADVRAELSDARALVTSLDEQYAVETRTGIGPRALEIDRDRNSAEGVAAGLERRLAQIDEELGTLLPELAQLEAVAQVGVEQMRLNEIEALLTEIDSEIVRVEKELEDASRGVSFDFRTQTQDYERLEAAFTNQDYSKLEDLVTQCAVLKQQLTEAGLADKVQDVSCSNTVVSQGVTRLQELQDNVAAYRAQCMGERPQPVRAPDAPVQIEGVISHLNGCMDFVTDGRERDTFKSRVSTLNTQRGDDVEPITEASVALFKDRQGNAVMSSIFAVIVDVLVLFCALVGLNVGLPERARAIDLLLNRARKAADGAAPNVEKQINIGAMEPNRQAMVDPVVSDLLRQGLAEYTDDEGTQLNLLRGATLRLTQMRKQEVSDAADQLDVGNVRRGRPARPGMGVRGGRD